MSSRDMNQMSIEELRVMEEINQKLSSNNLLSRLSYLNISGIHDATVTEWEWERIIPEEGAKPSIIVSESIEKLIDSS